MSEYKSKPVTVDKPAEVLFERFSNLSALREHLGNLPADVKDKVGDIRFSDDALILVTPQVGEIEFGVKSKQCPSKIVLEARRSPVPLEMTIGFNPVSESATDISAAINVDIPMMLKPLVGPKLQQAADKFGEIIAGLNR